MKKLNQLKRYNTGKAVLVALRRLYNNPYRWIKGCSTNSDNTACCLTGGIRVLAATNEARVEARDLLAEAIMNSNGYGDDNIIDFNDKGIRTREQVRAVLRKAYKS